MTTTTLHNYVQNPTFETGVGNWTPTNTLYFTTTTTGYKGAKAASITVSVANVDYYAQSDTVDVDVAAGDVWSVAAAVDDLGYGASVWMVIDGTAHKVFETLDGGAGWHAYQTDYTIPAAGTSVALRVKGGQLSGSGECHFDQIALIDAGGRSYFDGDTTDTKTATYSWSGTANASVSLAVVPAANPQDTPRAPVAPVGGWPAFDEAISWGTGPNSTMPADRWCSILDRTEGTWSSNRGRQYELDQVQTGTAASTLRNDDSAFDPDNDGSPFAPQLKLYRAYRRRAQYPYTGNLLTADQASAGFAGDGTSAIGGDLPAWVKAYSNEATEPTLSIVAGDGTSSNAYQVVLGDDWPGGAVNGVEFTGWSVRGGLTYTAQVALGTGTLDLEFAWFDLHGNEISTASTHTSDGVTYTVTATAPLTAVGASLRYTGTQSLNPTTITFSKVQIEVASTAGTWSADGVWYDVFTGYVAQWPQSWTDGGNYGTSGLQAIDAFGYLSQRQLWSPAYMEALAQGAGAVYPLDEPSSAAVAADMGGHGAPLTFAQVPPGHTSTAAFGASLDKSTSGWTPQGAGGPVLRFTNPTDGSGWTALQMPPTPIGEDVGGISTVLAFRPAGGMDGIDAYQCAWTYWQYALLFTENSGGDLHAYFDSTGNLDTLALTDLGKANVGDWHLFAFINTATNVTVYLDDTATTIDPSYAVPASPGGIVQEILGGGFNFVVGTTAASGQVIGFAGDMGLFARFDKVITSDEYLAIYKAFRYGAGTGADDASSSDRYTDILRWARWAGSSDVDGPYTSAQTLDYGPALELLAAAGSSGTDAVSALQTVVDTENGEHFVDKAGAVAFYPRLQRYNKTAALTFGEDAAAGEIPYTQTGFGFDPARLGNDTSLTQTPTGVAYRQIDADSIDDYGDVPLQRSLNTLDALEIGDAGTFLLNQYAQPVQRVTGISVDLAANPSAFGDLLALELGDPVTVNRRPPNGVEISYDGFVEQINWTVTDQRRAQVQLQISPNRNRAFWVLDDDTYSVLGTSTILGY